MLLHLLCKTIFWSVSTLLQDEALFCLKAVGRGRKVLLGIPLIEVWLGGGGLLFFWGHFRLFDGANLWQRV